MIEQSAKVQLPPIPAKRYFTIGEVSELCGVKPHVLRYWEQEFTQLKPVKRRGNRRYYQHHEVLLIRRIRELLYEQGFTISGARHRLDDGDFKDAIQQSNGKHLADISAQENPVSLSAAAVNKAFDFVPIKAELRSILNLLRSDLRTS
jgi:DNA-binding transcriptional MerR regulator